jgi:hypothetical protein
MEFLLTLAAVLRVQVSIAQESSQPTQNSHRHWLEPTRPKRCANTFLGYLLSEQSSGTAILLSDTG